MVRMTFWIAGLLALLGVVFYFVSNGIVHTLAPLGLGVLLAICGAIVAAKPTLRKHVMHVAMLLAVLGILGMIMPLTIALRMHDSLMLTEVGLTMLLCAVYLVLGIRSFIAARRNSEADEAGAEPQTGT